MRIDHQLGLSNAQAVTASAGSTNVIDLGVARRIGDGNPMSVFIKVDVAAKVSATDETYAFVIETDDEAAHGGPTAAVPSVSIDGSALTANSVHEIPIPQNAVFEEFMRLKYNTGGTAPAVTVTSWVGEQGSLPSAQKAYPKGYVNF